MTDITVKSLAIEIQVSVDLLVEQFTDAGLHKSENDFVTIKEKEILLAHLNHIRILEPAKLTVQRKTHSTLNILGIDGKTKSVQIEYRKLKAFYKDYPQEIERLSLIIKKQYLANDQSLLEKRKIYKSKTESKQIFLDKLKYNTENNEQIENKKNKNINKNIKEEKIKNKNKTLELKLLNKKEIFSSENNLSLKSKNKRINRNNFSEDVNAYFDDINYTSIQEEFNRFKDNHERNYKTKIVSLSKKKINKQHHKLKIRNKENHVIFNDNKRNESHKILSPIKQRSFTSENTINRNIIINETITVSELANKMAVKSSQLIKVIMKLGIMVTINQVIDQKIAKLAAQEMGYNIVIRRDNELETSVMSDRNIGLIPELRAPVVTIMGHVDHGKTSLLDYIRSTKVVSKEAGGITQHIGAYHVKTGHGMITFLDTPGHAAFSEMRARGTQITDIVVLVVAADDGVMPQTIEAINQAKSAKVPIIVAINKIDKPESDLNRIKNELSQHGVIPEEWGGECQFISVSAKSGIGIDQLLNAILLQSEILELKAIRQGMASGAVIESFLDKNRGAVATILVREGTLNKGDIVICGLEYGRIRAMYDEYRNEIMSAGPSIPVEILGLSGVPLAGDKVAVVRNERKAREVALYRQEKFREVKLEYQQKSKKHNMLVNFAENKIKEFNILLKADAHGSLEAISGALLDLSTDKIKIKIIGSGVGNITATDAMLASTAHAKIIGFNVRADSAVYRILKEKNLKLNCYSIIYKLIDEVKDAINNITLSIETKQPILGVAEVREVFESQKFGVIAGCIVIRGIIKRYNMIRILRNGVVIHEEVLESIRRFKEDVSEVRNGMECGIAIKGFNSICVGDVIEVI